MYIALLIVLLGSGIVLAKRGVSKTSIGQILFGALIIALTLLFYGFMGLWGEALWFESLGYASRFWKLIIVKTGLALAGGIVGWLVVHLLTLGSIKDRRIARYGAGMVGLIIGANWGYANWDTILKFINRVPTQLNDPILGKSTSFYLFQLPFYDAVYVLLLFLSIVALLTSLFLAFFRLRAGELQVFDQNTLKRQWPLYISGAALIFVFAWGKFLDRYHLMYSQLGAVTGPGWTDVNIRLWAYWAIAAITFLMGLLLLLSPVRRWRANLSDRLQWSPMRFHLVFMTTVGGIILSLWFIMLGLLPMLLQWLRVQPNEISLEKPYIEHNIRFTRYGFNLEQAQESEFPADDKLSMESIQSKQNLIKNVRLWDWRALDAVYKQFQEIRLYYEFVDVDVDRYHVNGDYRQVMVSAREMETRNLPVQSQTFVNKRFKYTHGYGITMNYVNEFTPQGLPNLLIKDIPPQVRYKSLSVEEPRIYYGERTHEPVVVNTREQEFDYPSGDENRYFLYNGTGGVKLSSLWRKFLFGWKFDGTQFFMSGYPTHESRVMFHREIRERVRRIAPFLIFEKDPYIVLAEGKLYWIIDAYTTSSYFPYSEPFSSREIIEYNAGDREAALHSSTAPEFNGVNYVRNSVKVVVDAYNGSVDLYIYDPQDPIIQVWSKILPGLFKERKEMPASLVSHVRYPSTLLLVQGLVYAKYHMSDPAVFYNQEDLWIRATEKYYDNVQPVEPYYIMWEAPDSNTQEFVLILPFTPKKRQVLIGWIAGMCDPGNYGKLVAFKFPKEKRILGTQQVETKIDQDRFLSGQLTLWNQGGSNVIRGNVLVIPIGKTLLYVEPIFLQAQTAAYPELRLVAVMHGDKLSYAESFEKALYALVEGRELQPAVLMENAAQSFSVKDLVMEADKDFQAYLRAMGEKRFSAASGALMDLQTKLGQFKNSDPKETPKP